MLPTNGCFMQVVSNNVVALDPTRHGILKQLVMAADCDRINGR
jgi:hypothetical protein